VIGLAVVCFGLAALIVLADAGSLSDRMPLQVIPRRFALVPLALGVVLVLLAMAN